MATISSPGIGSGLDIKSIVSQLVALEKQPLTQLQVKAATVQTKISAYSEIKSLVSNLADASGKLRSLTTFNGVAAMSSKPDAVSVSAVGGTGQNAFSVTVNQPAKAQSFASASLAKVSGASAAVGAGTLTLRLGSYGADFVRDPVTYPDPDDEPSFKSKVEISVAAGDTLADIASKINGSSAGLSATVLNTGDGERLLLRSKETGAEAGFLVEVTDADNNNADNLGLSRVLSNGVGNTGAMTQFGQNASVSVNGTIAVTSSSNTFKDIVSGVTVMLGDAAQSGDVAEVRVAPDTQPIRAAMEGFVAAYNALNSYLAEATKFDPGTRQGGLLQGDSFAIGLQNSLRGILQSGTSGSAFARLADIGVTAQLGGNLAIDNTKFTAALNQPEDLRNLFRIDNTGETTDGVALKFKRFADGFLAADGLYKVKEDALKRALDQNSKEQQRLNEKVSRIEAQLNRRYSALDAQVAGLTALNNYVAQQVNVWNNANSK